MNDEQTPTAATAETGAQDGGDERLEAAARETAVTPEDSNPTEDSTEEPTAETASDDDDGQTEASEAPIPPVPPPTFESMNLHPLILQALNEIGYEEPMKVQYEVYPHIAAGSDLLVQSRTGTGKTAAFAIPVLERIDFDSKGAQALILAPTRELALQVARETARIAQFTKLQVVPIYGGAPIKPQIDALEAGAQIVAGTPGRVLDHIRRRTFKTDQVATLVLDECDEMLSMGFLEEIEAIISALPPKEKRLNMMFSATIPPEAQRIAKRHMNEWVDLSLSSDAGISVEMIDHYYYVVSGMARTRDLLKVLIAEKPESAIIFCNTRDDTAMVAKFLTKNGYNSLAISSDFSQNERERVMKKMRDGKVKYLCATDVAARGIDISGLSHVINYTFPESPQVYVHRTGRTGRAGERGIAISLIGPREIGAFYFLKLTYKIRPEERDLPSSEELVTLQEGQRAERVAKLVEEQPTAEYLSLARRVWQSAEGERVVGALLQRLFDQRLEKKSASPRKPIEARGETEEQERKEPRERSERGRGGRERGGRDRDRGGRERGSRDGGGRDRDRSRGGRDGERSRPAADASATPKAAAEAAPERSAEATGEVGEDGKKRRRRRRRRREGGDDRPRSSQDQSTKTEPAPVELGADGQPKEFWETWADEKSGTTPDKTESPASGDTAEAGSVAADASESDAPRKAEESDGSVRLYVNIGKREKLDSDEVRTLLAEGMDEADAEKIGAISIRNTHCYVRVPEEIAGKLIDASQDKSIGEREVVVERARR